MQTDNGCISQRECWPAAHWTAGAGSIANGLAQVARQLELVPVKMAAIAGPTPHVSPRERDLMLRNFSAAKAVGLAHSPQAGAGKMPLSQGMSQRR